MTWQAFLDLSPAGGASQIPPSQALPGWVIFTGLYQQDFPPGDWKVIGKLVCRCGVWECHSWVGSGAQEREEEEETSGHIFPDVERQAISIISPQGAKVGCAFSSYSVSNFPRQPHRAVFPWLRCSFLIYEMGFIFPFFQGFLEIQLALAWNVSYRLLGAEQKWYRNKDRGQWSDSSLDRKNN